MNRIKELRQKENMRQVDFSQKFNITQATLSNWERGVHDPDNETLIKIANFFNVSTDYLLGKHNAPGPELVIPDALKGVPLAFHRGEFKDLTQEEVDNLAIIAAGYKALRNK